MADIDWGTIAQIAAATVAIIAQGAELFQSHQDEQREKETLKNIKETKEKQIESDIYAYIQSTQFKLQALNQQLLQAKQSVLLEQYERYKQGLRDRALAIVTQHAAGIRGGTANMERLAMELDRDKDINILKRNYLNVAKQIGIEKEVALMDLNTAIRNAILAYQGVEKAQSLQELDIASRYRTYRTQLAAGIASNIASAVSTYYANG